VSELLMSPMEESKELSILLRLGVMRMKSLDYCCEKLCFRPRESLSF